PQRQEGETGEASLAPTPSPPPLSPEYRGEGSSGQPGVASEQTGDMNEADEPWYAALRDAAAKLLAARQVMYPAPIHLLDLHLIDDKNPWPSALPADIPVNVLTSAAAVEKLATDQP